MHDGTSKPPEWAPHARAAYHETLARIALDDPIAADRMRERVARAIEMIATHPGLGTPGPRRNERGFAIPNTGHVIHYRVFAD
jgi:plasmid stabilization system protein ParE